MGVTIATVRMEGFEMNAKPFRFGCPAGAERFMRMFVTLNPCSPFRPDFLLVVFVNSGVGNQPKYVELEL